MAQFGSEMSSSQSNDFLQYFSPGQHDIVTTNSKFEIRNSKQFQRLKICKDPNKPVADFFTHMRAFRFVSDFDIRVSDFVSIIP